MVSIPLMIDLTGKKVVIVGGGKVAQRRIASLLEASVFIVVVSPEVTTAIEELYKQKRIQWKQKKCSPEDLNDAFLIIVATNNQEVNQTVVHSAPKQALVNAAADAELGNVQFPIQLRRGKLSIAISTNGASPILAKKIKKHLEHYFDDSYENYLDFLFEARTLIKQSTLSDQEKRLLLKNITADDYLNKDHQLHMLTWIKQQN
ncbi:NAD(P)-binding protein [Fictibacillus nanhaiensis]|uniref:NAD(P)-binding protein n=1 Tax=Fictibacillus nanhaiensis TaxID=742169 RepID=UPI00203AD97C|nr:NAD(P)-binding protein [Fictibacillus nanhaiensis]MCM3730360.1 NAD(P)-binding protein [Fictibacillus nanhaiensis]